MQSTSTAQRQAMCRLQSQLTMLTMRCRVLHNELLEARQEQGADDAAAAVLEAELLQCQNVEHAALSR